MDTDLKALRTHTFHYKYTRADPSRLTLPVLYRPRQLCDDVPAQVSALSNNVDQFYVRTGNSIGTFCDWPEEVYNRFSGSGGKDTVSVSYSNYQITGTIPTEFGLMTEATSFAMSTNYLRGPIPTQVQAFDSIIYTR